MGAGVGWGSDHFSRLKATCGGDFIMGQKMGPQSKQGAELEGEPGVMASLPQRRGCFELQKVTDVPAVTYTQRCTSSS